MKYTTACMALAVALAACNGETNTDADTTSDSTENAMMEESADAWTDLTQPSAWRNYKADTLSGAWKIGDNMIALEGKGGGDIITKDEYENFELEMEWKISEGGNSGVFFNVVEADSLPTVYYSGPEMQVLDNERHADAKIEKHRAGDNYDLQKSTVETVKPAGEWNQAKLVVNNGHVEHYLNGTKVVEYDLWSPTWEEQVAASKFAEMPMYGKAHSGHIALQDHGDQVWFRNVRIREL
ncbi:DUF1080 domain-containing protein [Catalinimonas alkaloidigena]|nr:DUF1080 domain-containing protein [Catalinimonas alkaloidigena]